MVVCGKTDERPRAYYNAIVENADPAPAPQGIGRFDSDAQAWRGQVGRGGPDQRALGGNIQMIGTPEQVGDYIAFARASMASSSASTTSNPA